MPLSRIQTLPVTLVTASNSGQATGTFTPGSTLILAGAQTTTGTRSYSVTDSQANAWAATLEQLGTNNKKVFESYLHNIPGGTMTITVTVGAGLSTSFSFVVHELGGSSIALETNNAFDEAGNVTQHFNAASGQINTAGPAFVSVVSTANSTLGTVTNGSGYTNVSSGSTSVVYQYQLSAGALSADRGEWTSTTARNHVGMMLAFRESTTPVNADVTSVTAWLIARNADPSSAIAWQRFLSAEPFAATAWLQLVPVGQTIVWTSLRVASLSDVTATDWRLGVHQSAQQPTFWLSLVAAGPTAVASWGGVATPEGEPVGLWILDRQGTTWLLTANGQTWLLDGQGVLWPLNP